MCCVEEDPPPVGAPDAFYPRLFLLFHIFALYLTRIEITSILEIDSFNSHMDFRIQNFECLKHFGLFPMLLNEVIVMFSDNSVFNQFYYLNTII